MSEAERFVELRGLTGKRRKAIDLTDDTGEETDHLSRTSADGISEKPKRRRVDEKSQSLSLPPCMASAPSSSSGSSNNSSSSGGRPAAVVSSWVDVDTGTETAHTSVCASTSECGLSSTPTAQADVESRRRNAIKQMLGECQQVGEAAQVERTQLGLRRFFTPMTKAEPRLAESSLTDAVGDSELHLLDLTEAEPSSSSSSSFQCRLPVAVSANLSGCISADLELALALQMEDNNDPELLPPQDIDQPRPVQRRRCNLMQRLARMDRDFTPEDYELLSGLDVASPGSVAAPGRNGKTARSERKLLLDRFPKIILDKSSAGSDCPICLEKMKPRMEARRLPCLHMFHRRCIDRWLLASDRPRCPVDQGELDLEI